MLRSMPVAVLAPFAFPTVRGNAVTVQRIVRGLRARHVDVALWDLSTTPEATIAAEVEQAQPRLIHAFHALRTGPLALRLARRLEAPLVVTLTGTDANHELLDPANAPQVRRVLEGASVVTAFDASIVDQVAGILPDLRARLVVVPQSVRFDAAVPFDLGAAWALPHDRVLFAVVGGIRPVKAPLAPLPVFDRVVAHEPRVRLLYAGPVLDRGEGEALAAALAVRPWARHIGAVPHPAIPALLAQADVVLNCSISEGGMANSVLEAMALGRAVLVSDIAGNGTLVEHDVTGVRYATDDELERQALRLARDGNVRARLGAKARARVEAEFPATRETEGYIAVYRRLVPAVATA
jgi:glycosyltransferase involved in cell wall biosynthesis